MVEKLKEEGQLGIEVGVEKEVRHHHTGNRLKIKHSQMTVVNHKMTEINDGYEGTGCHPPGGVDQKEITNVGFLVRDPLGDLRGEITKIMYHYENVSNRRNITVMKKGLRLTMMMIIHGRNIRKTKVTRNIKSIRK